MKTFDRDHPIWEIIRAVLRIGGLSLALWLNASNFDDTELRSIGMYLLIGEGGGLIARKGGLDA